MNRPTVLKPSAQIAQLSLISLKWHHITSIAVDGSRRGGSGSNHSRNLIGGYLKQQLEMTLGYGGWDTMIMMMIICKLNTIGYFHTYVDDSQLCLSSNLSCSWNQDDDVLGTSSISFTPTNNDVKNEFPGIASRYPLKYGHFERRQGILMFPKWGLWGIWNRGSVTS